MKKICFAITLLFTPILALANPGYYAQLQAGQGVDDASLINSGAGVNAGYLWGDNSFNYGIEAGLALTYSTFLFSTTTGIILSTQGIAKYTFESGFLAFTKLGLAYMNQTINDDFCTAKTSLNGIGPEASLGIGYQFTPQWELDLTASAIYAGTLSSNVSGGNGNDYIPPRMFSGGLFLGVTYHFA